MTGIGIVLSIYYHEPKRYVDLYHKMRNSVKLAVGFLSVSLLFSACSEKPAETEKQSVET